MGLSLSNYKFKLEIYDGYSNIVNETKERNKEIKRKKYIGEKRVRNGKRRVILLAFPSSHFSLFLSSISLSKGLLVQGRNKRESHECIVRDIAKMKE
jgi:hypothetical protein